MGRRAAAPAVVDRPLHHADAVRARAVFEDVWRGRRLGGGAEAYWHLGDALSLHGYYSYLDNENRPSIRIDQDLRGQHMFYLGMVVRLGAARR